MGIDSLINNYRRRRAARIMKRARFDEEGRWITTENGHKVHLNDAGEPDKGNPHVMEAMRGMKKFSADVVNQIKEKVDDAEYIYYGIRIDDDVKYEEGDFASESRIWDNGEPTDEYANGTCCVGIKAGASEEEIQKALKIAEDYYGDDVYLVGGDSMEYGEDAGEYVIKDAVVVSKLGK